jgi:NAD(P)-dependent dehydrogenase (short-subunit alcohol dehydrogenase family)
MKKTVVVTGSSSGFGLATTLAFARHGYHVFAGIRNKKTAQELFRIVKEESLPVTVIDLDITSEASVIHAMRTILSHTDHIDVLVNNAGFGFVGPVEDFTLEEMKEQFETNFFGQLRMSKAVIPLMRIRKRGTIINISSINGLVAFPLYGLYGATKHALEAACEALAFEVAPFGIRVVLVEPGTFLTNFTANRKHPQKTNTDDSAYRAMTRPFFQKIEHLKDANVIRRHNPSKVGNLLVSIAQSASPRLRYKVGADAYILHMFNIITPSWVKFFMMKKMYNWK